MQKKFETKSFEITLSTKDRNVTSEDLIYEIQRRLCEFQLNNEKDELISVELTKLIEIKNNGAQNKFQ